MIDVLKKRYGLKELHPQQREILEHLLDDGARQNLLYMAPVASGKTLPPLLKILEDKRKQPKRMTVWFMPTIALADDFIKRISKNGNYHKIMKAVEQINYVRFTGEKPTVKKVKKIEIAQKVDPDVLILSPESLADPAMLAWLLGSERNIGQIVLDEAHLFDEWGITFRRSYFLISWLIKTLRHNEKNAFKVIALSASLPKEKMTLVMRMLHFGSRDTLVSRGDVLPIGPVIRCRRPTKHEKMALLLSILRRNLRKTDQSGNPYKGVLFTPYIKEQGKQGERIWSVERMRETVVPKIRLKDDEWDEYTGKTNRTERRENLDDLHKKDGKIRLLLATSAFGFGVDVNELDFSVHVEMPEDLDRLYQEISRCSRKPLTGSADVFYDPHEVGNQAKRLAGTLNADTIRAYLGHMGIQNIRKGNKTLSLKKVLAKNDKIYNAERHAQMGADAYIDHALEVIIFLFRQGIIELRPLQPNNFPQKMSRLRRAFEKGKTADDKKLPYGGHEVVIPQVKLPISILRDVDWSELDSLVEKDKDLRRRRTGPLRKMGKNNVCHWALIAEHYNLGLVTVKKDGERRAVTACGKYCNVCLSGEKKNA